MLSLLKFLDGPWETAKGYLREDLDHIEAAINQRWAATFGDGNTLKASSIAGNANPATRSVTNTGTSNAPKWDQVDLATGVKGRLPFANFVQATVAKVLVGRGSTSAGDFQPISLGPGLTMVNTTLNASSSEAIARHRISGGL